jgi:hypothetical protein
MYYHLGNFKCKAKSNKAILIKINKKDVWIPVSQILSNIPNKNEEKDIIVREWWAKKHSSELGIYFEIDGGDAYGHDDYGKPL